MVAISVSYRRYLLAQIRCFLVGLRPEASLVIDNFSKAIPPNSNNNRPLSIAKIYEEIRARLNTSFWTGVVWTHLDEAEWNPAAQKWLNDTLPTYASSLTRIAISPVRTSLDYDSNTDLYHLAWNLAGAVMRSANTDPQAYVRNLEMHGKGVAHHLQPLEKLPENPIGPQEAEGLACLLFKLQAVYSIGASRHPKGKFRYLEEGPGRDIFKGLLAFARSLYIAWDMPRGGLHQFIRENSRLEVLPCGLVGERSVWSDLILLRALLGSKTL